MLYQNFKGDPDNVEQGFLQSELLIAVYKHLFNSPSSTLGFTIDADNDSDIENGHRFFNNGDRNSIKCHNRPDVASKVNMKLVTPRSIAYTSVQLHFSFSRAVSWAQTEVEGFNYPKFYNFVVDFFEEPSCPTAERCAQNLLSWWNGQIFLQSVMGAPKNTMLWSKNTLKQQRLCRKHEAAPVSV
ncbi:hypothetical protein BDQ17DRAFT_1435844 [Cyathus striatus]|nr:hypothetical protein BDQ17DRAFT_1435844 [Cyathus striatus]